MRFLRFSSETNGAAESHVTLTADWRRPILVAHCVTKRQATMSDTTTVRLPQDLKARLDQASRELARRKSWIIARALDQYLRGIKPTDLMEEARRQCRLANRADRRDRGWERFAEFGAK